MAEIEVRAVRPGEYAEAGEATARAFVEFAPPQDPEWQWYLTSIADVGARSQRSAVLAALVDGTIAGTATLELDRHIQDNDDWRAPLAADEAHLRMLGVDPLYRRRGVARALMDATIALAQHHRRSRFTLETIPEMRAALHLYESMGFVARGQREVQPGLILLDYELRLPGH